MQCLKINSIKVFFDKEKTQKNITNYNEPCNCQDCRNYYKNIESNMELREFLSQFGIDYLRTEEVISYELRLNDKDSPIHSMAYYDVFGYIEKEFSIAKGDYTILFKKNADVNVGHEVNDEYFWIVLDMVIPYVLAEERELSYVSDKTSIFTKIKELISKIFKPKETLMKKEKNKLALLETLGEIGLTLLSLGLGLFIISLFGVNIESQDMDYDLMILLGLVSFGVVLGIVCTIVQWLKKLIRRKHK